jgi:hypothetical protein
MKFDMHASPTPEGVIAQMTVELGREKESTGRALQALGQAQMEILQLRKAAAEKSEEPEPPRKRAKSPSRQPPAV